MSVHKRLHYAPVPCRNCGKKARKYTEPYFGGLEGEEYEGNLKVLKDLSTYLEQEDGSVKKYVKHILWDGESYVHDAGNFCTNRCAIEFANACWDSYERRNGMLSETMTRHGNDE